ncbi:MAG: hypothetical protein IPH78_12040 [Bacteroidetes bacterium]|nr:hypothetical protein [Bacteroidota bacterium]
MNKKTALLFLLSVMLLTASAQKNSDNKDKTFKEKVDQFGQDLIAQPDKAVDTNANKLINDNLSMEVPPLWREKGTYTIVQFNLTKTDLDPLYQTFPLPDKKITQSLIVNMGTTKKSAADKKAEVFTNIKKHMATYYKDGAITKSAQEIAEISASMLLSTEAFTTHQGKKGELLVFNDIESKQSSLIILLLLPDAEKGNMQFVQFNYIRFNYETNYPEDIREWRTFLYEDEQQAYVDFTKKMLQTFYVK